MVDATIDTQGDGMYSVDFGMTAKKEFKHF
jgi:hypothetical protein